MTARTALLRLIIAAALLLTGLHARAAEALPDFLSPFPDAAGQSRSDETGKAVQGKDPFAPNTRGIRIMEPPRPGFEFRNGDRVVLLGDSLLQGETALGYLETRLTVQQPNTHVTFHHYSHLTEHPLGATNAGGTNWLENLQLQVRPTQHTVAILAFGTDAIMAGRGNVQGFQQNMQQLVRALSSSIATTRVRVILLAPISPALLHHPPDELSFKDMLARHYATALRDLAGRSQCEYIDLYGWSQLEQAHALQLARESPSPEHARLTDTLELTPYGYWRMTVALEFGLRWRSNTWRFGYKEDGSLREGQFGIELTGRNRSATRITANIQEERLPTPTPSGVSPDDPAPRPLCYIQAPGLEPGDYALDISGLRIQQASAEDWARYQIIREGPSWQQSEDLRQIILRKNALRAANPAAAEILALESAISRQRLPAAHTLEIYPVDSSR